MPNWCSNYCSFSGTEEAIQKAFQELKKCIEKETKEKNAQIPFGAKCQDGFFFDTYVSDETPYKLEDGSYAFDAQWETKWAPNTPDVVLFAKKCGVSFSLDYSERGCLVYGRNIYDFNADSLTEYYLTSEEQEQVEYIDEDHKLYEESPNLYFFEGEIYETEVEPLEIILERNIKGQLCTISQIKQAVDEGHIVRYDEGYTVYKDSLGEYWIKGPNGHKIGLHGTEGTEFEHVCNGDLNKFYKEVQK